MQRATHLTQRSLSTLLLFTQAFLICQASANSAHDILKKARLNLDSKSDSAHIVLKIREPGGEVKSQEMTMQILRTGDGFKSLIRMTAPADVKDTALLAEMQDGLDQEWLYLPSTKQVRRIASGKKSSGILGSELSVEDLDPAAFKDASLNLVKQTAEMAVIAVKPKKGTSEYSKLLTTFSMPDGLPRKTEYFKGNDLEKTVEYLNYKPFAGKIFRAQNIRIESVKKKRGTDIEFTEIVVNPPLLAKDFTPEALKAY